VLLRELIGEESHASASLRDRALGVPSPLVSALRASTPGACGLFDRNLI